MRTVLAITAATSVVGVALRSDSATAAITVSAGRRHAETLAPAIEALTTIARCPLGRVELIAVDAGPGLFTGLRVGVATAKALASALGRPMAVGSSLDLLARPHAHAGRPVVSVVDARRAEVFWAAYEPRAGRMVRTGEPIVGPPEKLAEQLSEIVGPAVLVGDGARRYGELLGVEPAAAIYDHPSAEVLAAMADELPLVEADQVRATYLRGADVRIGWETR